MEEKLRNSGLDFIEDVPWGTHFCLFHQTEKDLIDIISLYFKAGLKANELCIWAIPEPFEVEEAIKRLKEAIPDFDLYLEKKQVEIIPYSGCYIKNDIFDPETALNYWTDTLSRAFEKGYSGLRLAEDRYWLEKENSGDCAIYEKKMNSFIGKHKMMALCPYSLNICDPNIIIYAVSNHQITLIQKEGKWEKIENYGWEDTEKELYESEERYKAFFESSIDAVLLTSPEGTIYAANPEACRVFGMSEEEITRTGRSGIIDLSDPRLRPALEERERTGKFKGELNFKRKDGTIFPGEVSSALFTDKKGQIRTAMVIRDVTERKNAEKALQLSEERYRLLFNTMSEGILFGEVILDEAGKPIDFLCLDINPAFETQTGLTRRKVIGRKIRQVLPNVESSWIERYAETALTGKPAHFTDYNQDLGHWYEVYTFSPAKGQFYSVFFNITERRKAEEALRESEKKYRTLFETMQEAFFIADIITNEKGEPVDYRIIEANKSFEIQTGVPLNKAIGSTTLELYPDLDPCWIRTYGHVALTGIPVHFEHYVDIQDRYYEASAYQVRPGRFAAIFLDVTSRKHAEEILIKSENEFRTLAENSPDIILRFDRENRHIYANPEAVNTYGISKEEIKGKTHFELGRKPEQVELWEKCHKKVFATGKPQTIEFYYKSSRGKEYYFDTKIVPEFVEDKVASILVISRDITAAKKAEAKLKETLDNLENIVQKRTAELENAYISLKESKERLAEAQRIAHIGNWERNLATGEIYWSEEMYRIFGLDSREFRTNYDIFLNHIHPEDKAYVNTAVKGALKGKSFDIDYRIMRADGEERIIHARGEAIFDNKKLPVLIRGTAQDITVRKKAEEKTQNLANIVEFSNDAIVTKSLKGLITSWNRGAEQIYGYSAEEILGKPISILEPPEFAGEIEKLTDRIKYKESVQQYETVRLRKDGQKIPVSITLSPVFNSYGEFIAVSVISRDITKRKKAEEALAKIEAGRLKEIHHRIKNNLQVISSLLDLEVGKFDSRGCIKNSEVLEAFRESQDRVISIALIHEELYEGDGAETLNFSLYLQRLAENLFQTYKLGNSRDINLNMELAENILFDMDTAVPLGLIVNELVSNSLKHAFPEKRKGEIQIKLCKSEKPQKNCFENDGTEKDAAENPGLERGIMENIGISNNGIIEDDREANKGIKDTGIGNSGVEDSKIKGGRIENNGIENGIIENKKKGLTRTTYCLSVSDNGIGIPETFDFENSDTLGIQLITLLVNQLDGELELKRGRGTEFIMEFTVQQKH
ncbi:MAG: PAS domain S-box protein [Methanosarcina sp.]